MGKGSACSPCALQIFAEGHHESFCASVSRGSSCERQWMAHGCAIHPRWAQIVADRVDGMGFALSTHAHALHTRAGGTSMVTTSDTSVKLGVTKVLSLETSVELKASDTNGLPDSANLKLAIVVLRYALQHGCSSGSRGKICRPPCTRVCTPCTPCMHSMRPGTPRARRSRSDT